MKGSSRAVIGLLSVLALGPAGGCARKEPERPAPKAVVAAGPPRLEQMFGVTIVPTSDGAAYAVGQLGGVWYLRGATATLVRESDDAQRSGTSK